MIMDNGQNKYIAGNIWINLCTKINDSIYLDEQYQLHRWSLTVIYITPAFKSTDYRINWYIRPMKRSEL